MQSYSIYKIFKEMPVCLDNSFVVLFPSQFRAFRTKQILKGDPERKDIPGTSGLCPGEQMGQSNR